MVERAQEQGVVISPTVGGVDCWPYSNNAVWCVYCSVSASLNFLILSKEVASV